MIVFPGFHPIIEHVKLKATFLFLFILGIVFPLNWLREKSAFLRAHFAPWLAPEWVHVIAHLALFGALVFFILRSFHLPLDQKTFIVLLAVILLVGMTQELLQLPTKGRTFGWPEMFDLGVDLLGGMLGRFFYAFFQRKKTLS
jgi:glycopeptide antibiotics resistance protein